MHYVEIESNDSRIRRKMSEDSNSKLLQRDPRRGFSNRFAQRIREFRSSCEAPHPRPLSPFAKASTTCLREWGEGSQNK